MQKHKMVIDKFNCCVKCGHTWKQRGEKIPMVCPKCKNPNWNTKDAKHLVNLIIGDFWIGKKA